MRNLKNPDKISGQIFRCLFALTLICLLSTCAQQQSLPPGTAVAWGNMDGLFDRSDSQLETRKNDLELKIALSKKRFNEGKEIKVVVSLVNKTDENINIREMDSMWIFGNSTSASYGIQILVTSLETGSPLESTGLFSLPGFLDEGFPPPEVYSVITPGDTSRITIELLDIFGVITEGNYSMQMIYTNYDFGSLGWTDSESYFIDFNAWMGTLSSNIEYFQVTAD